MVDSNSPTLNETVVAATPGFFVLTFHSHDNEEIILRFPVLAWRIREGYAYPITYEPLDGRAYPILRPDGRVDVPEGTYYKNEEQWLVDERKSDAFWNRPPAPTLE